jgi:hypothetical protein
VTQRRFSSLPFPRLLGLIAPLAACSDDGAADPADATPRHAIATTQFLPDGEVTLLALVDDPALPAELDVSRAVEIGGAAAIFGRDGRSLFAVGSSDSPVVTRYEVGDDGALVAGPQLSFANTGISSAFKRPGLVPFISDTKAYWLDDTTQQAIIWNPAEMVIEGELSLAAAARDGFVFELNERAILRDDGLLFVGADHRTADDGEAGVAVVLVIDTASDRLVEVLEDQRCGNMEHLVLDASGTIYAGTGAVGAVLHALDRPAGYPAPCLLRILPGTRTFDASFHVSIASLVGGRSAGRLVAGRNGQAFVLALDEAQLDFQIGADTEMWAPWEATAWQWWRIELGSVAPGVLAEGAPVASAAGHVLRAGGVEYIAHVNFEEGATTLLVAGDDGNLDSGLQVTGLPYGLVSVR